MSSHLKHSNGDMSWIASIGIAIITAAFALFCAGTVSALAVDWYSISSFEGGSGFFVVGNALLGGIVGFVVGLIASRVVAGWPRGGFLKGLGVACGLVLGISLAATGIAYFLADIPPTIDGETLSMAVEIRWPADPKTPGPRDLAGPPSLRIGALSGNVARRIEPGPVFMEDARQEGGRWILPGVVPIFTRRGGRLLMLEAKNKSIAAFDVPLPRNPDERERQWSDWMPHPRPGAPPLPDQFTYRFKVIKVSEPIRRQTIGAFEIDTIASAFYYVSDSDRLGLYAKFHVKYKGQPIQEVRQVDTVTVVGRAGSATTLFVTSSDTESAPPCALIIDEGAAVRVEKVAGCPSPASAQRLTSDVAQFKAAQDRQHKERLTGWIDRESMAEPGLYHVRGAVIDTRSLTVAAVDQPENANPDTSVPPLGLSPDEHSFAWLAYEGSETRKIVVTNWQAKRSYELPIDRARMRYPAEGAIDPAWLLHHFEWTRGADGADELRERPAFTPLPYRGDLSLTKPGSIQSYTLRFGGAPLREAIVDLLVKELGGERVPEEPDAYRHRVKVAGKTVNVAVIGSPEYVYVTLEGDDGDPGAMSSLAAKLDAALATGRYDALFVIPDRDGSGR
jgi:hypothetical protein